MYWSYSACIAVALTIITIQETPCITWFIKVINRHDIRLATARFLCIYRENILSFLTKYIASYDTAHAVNTKDLYIICTMLGQRWRRWADAVQMLYKCCMFTGHACLLQVNILVTQCIVMSLELLLLVTKCFDELLEADFFCDWKIKW